MKYVVIVDIHEHSDGLTDDQRDPDRRVAIVTSQEAAHEHGERNLKPTDGLKEILCSWYRLMSILQGLDQGF